jgi:hypothetical protein
MTSEDACHYRRLHWVEPSVHRLKDEVRQHADFIYTESMLDT